MHYLKYNIYGPQYYIINNIIICYAIACNGFCGDVYSIIRNNKVVWLKIGKFRIDGKREAIILYHYCDILF